MSRTVPVREWVMAAYELFTYGFAGPVLAFLLSVAGCLIGLLLLTKARGRRGRPRLRLLVYAALSIGGIGIWLLHFNALLGFGVPDSDLRYDPALTAASLGLALGTAMVAVFLAGHGRAKFWRFTGAGVVIGAGVAAVHLTGMTAVQVAGRIDVDQRRLASAGVVAVCTAVVAMWCAAGFKGVRAAAVAAVGLGAAVAGMHYTALSAITVRLYLDDHGISGLSPRLLTAPLLTLGVFSVVVIAFFTLGNSTMDDVRRIYHTGPGEREDTNVIATRIIAEVTARVSAEADNGHPARVGRGWPGLDSSVTVDPARLWINRSHVAELRPSPRPRPRPRLNPPWANMPVWGTAPAPPVAQPAQGGPAARDQKPAKPSTRKGRFPRGKFGRTMRQ
jgi:NO-binding membrane sensor protein with MHYT domain